MNLSLNQLTHEVIGAAIEIHRKLGPGLLESAYRRCLVSRVVLERHSVRAEYPCRSSTREFGWNADIESTFLLTAGWLSK